jgi:hypothetical protein
MFKFIHYKGKMRGVDGGMCLFITQTKGVSFFRLKTTKCKWHLSKVGKFLKRDILAT